MTREELLKQNAQLTEQNNDLKFQNIKYYVEIQKLNKAMEKRNRRIKVLKNSTTTTTADKSGRGKGKYKLQVASLT